jgi:hypothetical protein
MATQLERLQYSGIEAQIVLAESETGEIDPGPICGTWINTNPMTRGIARVTVEQRGAAAVVRVLAAGPEGLIDWGEVGTQALYARDSGSRKATAFEARYDFGFMESLLQANLSLGLLVVAGLNIFKDGSGRRNYFSREFFYQAEPE